MHALSTFDVPGTITYRDVNHPAPGETPEQRIHRLAQKAIIEGVRILRDPRSGLLSATSARGGSGHVYRLNLTARSCSCPGYASHHICKHVALALVGTGLVPAPAAEPVTCPECHGERGFKRSCGGRLSDWVWETCRACDGAGSI